MLNTLPDLKSPRVRRSANKTVKKKKVSPSHPSQTMTITTPKRTIEVIRTETSRLAKTSRSSMHNYLNDNVNTMPSIDPPEDKSRLAGISPSTYVQNKANRFAMELSASIENESKPKVKNNLETMLNTTSKKIKAAVQRLNTAINKHSSYVDLDSSYTKVAFEGEESVLLRMDVEFKVPPAALLISY